ncbi:MAG: sigma 54-interacting transcriptional regulator [Bacteroidota bacterium]
MLSDQQIVGKSKHVEKLRKRIAQLASSRKDVLIYGEAGVGKTTVASSIVNDDDTLSLCLAQMDEPALEYSLSGVASGTVLFEELESASFRNQDRVAKFVSGRPKSVRVLVTLRASVEELLAQGKLSDDLYTCISKLEEVEICPLRERPEDIPLLVKHFASGLIIDINTLDFLVKQPWHENVRQLKTVIDRCVSSAVDGNFVLPEELIDERTEVVKMISELMENQKPALQKSLDIMEGTIIQRTLERFGFNESRAAQFLGMTEQVFGQKVKALAIAKVNSR